MISLQDMRNIFQLLLAVGVVVIGIPMGAYFFFGGNAIGAFVTPVVLLLGILFCGPIILFFAFRKAVRSGDIQSTQVGKMIRKAVIIGTIVIGVVVSYSLFLNLYK